MPHTPFEPASESPRSFATVALTADEIEAVSRIRMDPRHDRLNRLLDEKQPFPDQGQPPVGQ